jgi:hypothetical protein
MEIQFASTEHELTVVYETETLALRVTAHGKTWQSLPGFEPYLEYLPLEQRRTLQAASADNQTARNYQGEKILLRNARAIEHVSWQTGVGQGVRSIFKGFTYEGRLVPLELEIRIWVETVIGVLHFELIPLVDDSGVLRVMAPAPFELPGRDARSYTVLPMMQGCLIPNNWPQELHTHSAGRLLSRAAYMPWWGQVEEGAGWILIADSPWDAGYCLEHPAGGPTLLYPVWHASLGSLAYNRSLQIHFMKDGDYNDLAKIYRGYAREHGLLRTLAEKAAVKPVIERLIGSPVVHTGIYTHIQPESVYYDPEHPEVNDAVTPFSEVARQMRELHAKGLRRAYVHLDGWGVRGYDNQHPDILPPCEQAGGWEGMRQLVDTCHELGDLIITHDQYRDYYKDAATYDPEQAVHDENGGIPGEAVWYGGAQSFLCARFAPAYVRRNHTQLEQAGIHLDGAYLDVFAVVDLDECFHPAHRMSRRECMDYRCQSFAHLGSQGKIVSSEESIDFAVPFLELVHHGPYALTPGYDEGTGRGIPVPLFNLVYHDCLILPWTLTSGGWGIPQEDSGLLHATLNAGSGYLSIDASPEEIARVQELCELQQRLAKVEMLRHEFIGGHEFVEDSLRRQRTTYADGTRVEVDFDSGEIHITEP